MRSYKKQRTRMWNNNPNCIFCGVLTILPEHLPQRTNSKGVSKIIVEIPDNMTTIEHLNSRNSVNRNTKNIKKEIRRVLCCYKCNQERNEKELEFFKPIWGELSKTPKKQKKIILKNYTITRII